MTLIIPGDDNKSLLIDITDIYEHRARKKKELEFYSKELEKLHARLALINREIGVTETIITLIEREEILDLQEAIKEKKKLK